MARYVNTKEAMEYLSAGKNKTLEIGEAAGAIIRIGQRFTRYDLDLIDKYMANQRNCKKED